MQVVWSFFCAIAFGAVAAVAQPAEPVRLDAVSAEQAEAERKQLEAGEPRTATAAMVEFAKSGKIVHYQAGERKLPGFLFRPSGEGKHPAVLWNHGSEKEPRMQPELARFYSEHGFVFFAPVRHGH